MSSETFTVDRIKKLLNELIQDTSPKQYNELREQLQYHNRNQLSTSNNTFDFLYPHLDDPNFNIKIAEKKEFNDTKQDTTIYNVQEYAEKLCNPSQFELAPHQLFVRNYLSVQTPYKSLLLYHGLGTGKTCSAISVCEEMRTYLDQIGVSKRIIIVASPNVQSNFKLQLFDKRKLTKNDGMWNLNACTGNKFLKEINPMNMRGLTRKEVISQIKRKIRSAYMFLGPGQFANYIERVISRDETSNVKLQRANIKREFSNRLIVIDEVHNLRVSKDLADKKTTKNLMEVVKYTDNLKLLFLSATPVFNDPEEIIWLINLMNVNDNRPGINVSDVFDNDGNFKIDKTGREIGKELFMRKATGYVSYLRGEYPYTFPFRIYPSMFMKTNTLEQYIRPRYQINNAVIIQPLERLDLCVVEAGSYQNEAYSFIIENSELIQGLQETKGVTYHTLAMPLQALNIVYPVPVLNEDTDLRDLVGRRGLDRIVKYDRTTKKEFQYRDGVIEQYGDVFSLDTLGKYSSKIQFICDKIKQTPGTSIVYSQYIDGGCLPVALALERMGLQRHGGKNLFKTKATTEKMTGTYVMITGDTMLSPDNVEEIKAATNVDSAVRVIITSEAGSEGLDFKNIRAVHILEPWYNLNRTEQIIGRGVRNCSHKSLPFAERNTEIYLYGTQLTETSQEAADMYVYRLAERKSVKIGQVTRLLKQVSVDCLLNNNVMTQEQMQQSVRLVLGSGKQIDYSIGDQPFSPVCDYMKQCNYVCTPNKENLVINEDTYDETFITMNIDVLVNKIKELFKERYVYTKKELILVLNHAKQYPLTQIDSALTQLVDDESESIFDMLGRKGKLVNIVEFYMFQPIEIDSTISMYDRKRPVAVKFKNVNVKLDEREKVQVMNSRVIIEAIEADFNRTLKDDTATANWYDIAGIARVRLQRIISQDNFDTYVIEHIIDMLRYDEKIALYTRLLYSTNLSEFEQKVRQILNDRLHRVNGVQYIIAASYVKQSRPLNVLKVTDTQLVPAEPLEIQMLYEQIKGQIEKRGLNQQYGFMGEFKHKYAVFRIRDMRETKRQTGYRCDQKGKRVITEVYNTLMNELDVSVQEDVTNARDLCVDLEILFRYLTSIKRPFWFLNFEMNIIANLLKIA